MSTTVKEAMDLKIGPNGNQDNESIARGSILGDNVDDAVLRANGHKSDLKRQFNWLSALSLGFSITNSWVGYLVSLPSHYNSTRATNKISELLRSKPHLWRTPGLHLGPRCCVRRAVHHHPRPQRDCLCVSGMHLKSFPLETTPDPILNVAPTVNRWTIPLLLHPEPRKIEAIHSLCRRLDVRVGMVDRQVTLLSSSTR
jgi:hypothetical protein